VRWIVARAVAGALERLVLRVVVIGSGSNRPATTGSNQMKARAHSLGAKDPGPPRPFGSMGTDPLQSRS
jgi:hypothetical protein